MSGARLILNADDFGFSDETLEETVSCFEAGGLTSATITTNMPAAARACEYAKSRAGDASVSFGVHLMWVGDGVERPLSDPKDIPSLIDAQYGNGLLINSQRARLAALRGGLADADIEREMVAQITYALDHGVAISHVDSHGHMHKFGPFRRALRRVLPRFGITRVRSVQDVYLKKPLKSPNFWVGPVWRRAIRAAFTTTDHLYLPRSAEDEGWTAALLDRLARLGGVTEIGLHPGREEAWRVSEKKGAIALARLARERGVGMCTWREV